MTHFLTVLFGSMTIVIVGGLIVGIITILGVCAIAGWIISKQ